MLLNESEKTAKFACYESQACVTILSLVHNFVKAQCLNEKKNKSIEVRIEFKFQVFRIVVFKLTILSHFIRIVVVSALQKLGFENPCCALLVANFIFNLQHKAV